MLVSKHAIPLLTDCVECRPAAGEGAYFIMLIYASCVCAAVETVLRSLDRKSTLLIGGYERHNFPNKKSKRFRRVRAWHSRLYDRLSGCDPGTWRFSISALRDLLVQV